MESWIIEHIYQIGIGTAIVSALTAWFRGFFNQLLPTPAATKIWVIEGIKDLRWIRPSPGKFLILVARLDGDDVEGTHTRAVARAFRGEQGIERTQTARKLSLSDKGIGSDAEIRALATGRAWLARRNADLLIWGEVLEKGKFLSLWFTSKDATSDFQQSSFPLEAAQLDQSFNEAARTQLVAISLSSIRPATEPAGKSYRDILRPVADRLRTLINNPLKFTSRQVADLKFALGVALCAISEEEGVTQDLQEAVGLLGSYIDSIDRIKEPLAWANGQHYCGIALTYLGRETASTEYIENAVEAFRAALDERTEDRVPLEWGNTQNALGIALAELAERKTGVALFDDAITAYDAALTVRTLERSPLNWAATTNNQSNAVLNRALRGNGTTEINKSIAALEKARQVATFRSAPLLHSGITVNLGVAFYHLDERSSDEDALPKALSAFHSVLHDWSAEQVPRLWVKAQINIARALIHKGEREIGTETLEEAEDRLKAALEICTREFSTLLRAYIHNNIRISLLRMAERELKIQGPLQAQVLRIESQQTTDWISTEGRFTTGLGQLQKREYGIDHLEQAVASFRESLNEMPREKLPLEWADTQHNFAMALTRLGEQEEGTEHLLESLSAVNSALEIWTRKDHPFQWAIGKNTLGWILIRLGERDPNTASYCETSITVCRCALKVQTEDELPRQRAITQTTLGNALSYLGKMRNDLSMLVESENTYTAALGFYRSISAERDSQALENNLRIVQGYIQGRPDTSG
jgi:tetratricopeptide (TPR) repeat protein